MSALSTGTSTSRAASARASDRREARGAAPRETWPVAALMLVALVVRVPALGRTNLWLDEANSWMLAKYPWADLVANLRTSPGGPFYFLVLHQWVALFGDSETALRSLSLALSVALIPLVYALGARVLSRPAAFWGTLLLALSPLHLYFAQEARVYMLAALLATGCATAYVVWREEVWRPEPPPGPGPRAGLAQLALVAYAACGILALYTLNLSALLLIALNIDAAAVLSQAAVHARRSSAMRELSRSDGAAAEIREPEREPMSEARRRVARAAGAWTVAQVALILATLPLVVGVDVNAAVASQLWRRPLGPADAIRGFLDFFATSIHGLYEYPWNLVSAIVDGWGAKAVFTNVLAYPLTIMAVLTALSYPPRDARPGGRRVLYLALLVPLLAGTAASITRELALPRYFLFTTPFLYLLLGGGLARMPWRLRAAIATVLVVSMTMGVRGYREVGSRDSDYRPIAGLLSRSMRPGDNVLVQPPEVAVPLSYYLTRALPWGVRLPGPLTVPPLVGLGAAAPLTHALVPNARARTWVVLDYRSRAFASPPDTVARVLSGHVASDTVITQGGSGVRIVHVDSAAPRR